MPAPTGLTALPVAAFDFEDTLESSIGDFEFSETGSYDASGKFGKCYNRDFGEFSSATISLKNLVKQSFSVSAWVRIDEDASGNGDEFAWGWRVATTTGEDLGIFFRIADATPDVTPMKRLGIGGPGGTLSDFSYSFPDTVFQHVLFVYDEDEDEGVAYINGVQALVVPTPRTSPNADQFCAILDHGSFTFTDQLLFFDYALTAAEAIYLYGPAGAGVATESLEVAAPAAPSGPSAGSKLILIF